MDFETIKSWLVGWMEKQIKICRIKGIAGLTLGPIALAVASLLVYGLIRLFSRDARGNLGSSAQALWITVLVLPCLFVGNRLSPRRDLMNDWMEEGADYSIGGRYMRRNQVLYHFFMWILFTGPRLFDWAITSFRQIKTWKKMDTHSCAAVLWLLLLRAKKVPFEDIQGQLDWLNMEAVLPELRQIPGILFLKGPPAGLSLTQDLRDLVRNDLTTKPAR